MTDEIIAFLLRKIRDNMQTIKSITQDYSIDSDKKELITVFNKSKHYAESTWYLVVMLPIPRFRELRIPIYGVFSYIKENYKEFHKDNIKYHYKAYLEAIKKAHEVITNNIDIKQLENTTNMNNHLEKEIDQLHTSIQELYTHIDSINVNIKKLQENIEGISLQKNSNKNTNDFTLDALKKESWQGYTFDNISQYINYSGDNYCNIYSNTTEARIFRQHFLINKLAWLHNADSVKGEYCVSYDYSNENWCYKHIHNTKNIYRVQLFQYHFTTTDDSLRFIHNLRSLNLKPILD